MNLIKTWKDYYDKNKKSVLTGVALGGVIANSYLWYSAGLKIDKILTRKDEEMKLVQNGDKEAERTVLMETVKEIIPKMILPLSSTILTGSAIIFANRAAVKELAVLSTAYAMTQNNLTDIKNKTQEMFGVKKARDVEDQVTKDRYLKEPIKESFELRSGNVPCKDLYTGRTFQSNASKIQHAIDQIAIDLIQENWVSLNDFYDKIGLDQVKLGDDLGWDIRDTMSGRIPIHFTSLLTEYNEPCLVVEFDVRPISRRNSIL